jgi:hypothetical protein
VTVVTATLFSATETAALVPPPSDVITGGSSIVKICALSPVPEESPVSLAHTTTKLVGERAVMSDSVCAPHRRS